MEAIHEHNMIFFLFGYYIWGRLILRIHAYFFIQGSMRLLCQ